LTSVSASHGGCLCRGKQTRGPYVERRRAERALERKPLRLETQRATLTRVWDVKVAWEGAWLALPALACVGGPVEGCGGEAGEGAAGKGGAVGVVEAAGIGADHGEVDHKGKQQRAC
jgi:hypothetical protein